MNFICETENADNFNYLKKFCEHLANWEFTFIGARAGSFSEWKVKTEES